MTVLHSFTVWFTVYLLRMFLLEPVDHICLGNVFSSSIMRILLGRTNSYTALKVIMFLFNCWHLLPVYLFHSAIMLPYYDCSDNSQDLNLLNIITKNGNSLKCQGQQKRYRDKEWKIAFLIICSFLYFPPFLKNLGIDNKRIICSWFGKNMLEIWIKLYQKCNFVLFK